MTKGWTTTKLIAIGSFSVLTLVLQLFGASLVAITGIPLMGGVINIFVTPSMTAVALFVIDQVGVVTIMYTILGILQLPLPLSGTPGFLAKIPILTIGGLIADAIYLFFKKNKIVAAMLIGGSTSLYFTVAILKTGTIFKIPGIDQTVKFINPPVLILTFFIGCISGYLGWLIYSKIKSAAVVKRIQGI